MNDQPLLIVLVGHCGPDAFMLRSAIRRAVPGATVEMANDDPAFAAALKSARLLLVNRVLDGEFQAPSGIDLIRRLAPPRADGTVLMLVSNHDDAQAEAVAAGAVPGFGKKDAYSDAARTRLEEALRLKHR